MAAGVSNGTTVRVQLARSPSERRRRIPVRLQVFLHKTALDRELAAGADPDASEQLSFRGAQLTGERSRRRIADAFEALITPPPELASLSSAVRPEADLRESRAVLGALIRRLRSDEPVAPRGVAILRWLLTDGESPLYSEIDPARLSSILRLAASSMTVGSPEP